MTKQKDLPISLEEKPSIQWSLFKSIGKTKIYTGSIPGTNEFYAATNGPPFFCFVNGTQKEVMKQVNAAIELYDAYLKEKNDDTSNIVQENN